MTGNATTALLTVLWGLLAQLTGPRTALVAAGVLLLATPVLLVRGRFGERQIAAVDDLAQRPEGAAGGRRRGRAVTSPFAICRVAAELPE